MYTARCKSRGELVYIPRCAIQDLLERFSPWLVERFDYFRQAVVEGMHTFTEDGTSQHANVMQPVDWAAIDLRMPEDDISLDAMHCKTLLRSASLTRPALSVLRNSTATPSKSMGATQTRPAMPQVNSFSNEGPVTPLKHRSVSRTF